MTVGSLFSGIGGLDLGLEWAGFETVWFCEIEKFPQAVLRKHWPNVPIIEDVRDVTSGNVQRVDVIAGGFPCQDISWAGKGRGIDYDLSEQEGTRSGLWWEMWRVIRDLRPRYVIAENVPALTHRGLDIVLGSLAEIGYDAEWQTVSAAGVGAPHIRERVFIVAYPNGGGGRQGWQREGLGEVSGRGSDERGATAQPGPVNVAHSGGERCEAIGRGESGESEQHHRGDASVSQPSWFGGPIGQPWPVSFRVDRDSNRFDDGKNGAVSGEQGDRTPEGVCTETRENTSKWLEVEYDFCGLAHGVSDRVGALKGYGNAVVPQVGYLIGRAVRAHAEENGWWT